jgi:hypothetical protein
VRGRSKLSNSSNSAELHFGRSPEGRGGSGWFDCGTCDNDRSGSLMMKRPSPPMGRALTRARRSEPGSARCSSFRIGDHIDLAIQTAAPTAAPEAGGDRGTRTDRQTSSKRSATAAPPSWQERRPRNSGQSSGKHLSACGAVERPLTMDVYHRPPTRRSMSPKCRAKTKEGEPLRSRRHL